MSSLLIVQTGVANLASVRAAFERLHVSCTLSADPEQILKAKRVMLPGVGAFQAGMAALEAEGGALAQALGERFETDRPTMAICLGLQLLANSSDESPGVKGLGILKGQKVTRFEGASLKVPQLGWNQVETDPAARFLRPGYAYYANSFRLTESPEGWTPAWSHYGGRFIAALERGATLACQFHPELSGPWGQALIKRWLEATC